MNEDGAGCIAGAALVIGVVLLVIAAGLLVVELFRLLLRFTGGYL